MRYGIHKAHMCATKAGKVYDEQKRQFEAYTVVK